MKLSRETKRVDIARETASKTAGRLTLEMQPKTRTYSHELNQQQCKLTGIRDTPAPCQSSGAIPYDFSELKDMIAWRDRIN